MKKLIFFGTVVLLLFCITLIFNSCSKDDGTTGPGDGVNTGLGSAGFTVNGGGYNNRTFSFSVASGGFNPDENLTVIGAILSSSTDSVYLAITFPGNQTGTFTWSDSAGICFWYYGADTVHKYFCFYDSSGSTTVSSYGVVGGYISGTFSGKLIGGTIPYTTLDTVTISNGSFSAKRYY